MEERQLTLHSCIQQFYKDYGGTKLNAVPVEAIADELKRRLDKVTYKKPGMGMLLKNKIYKLLDTEKDKSQLLIKLNEIFMSMEDL